MDQNSYKIIITNQLTADLDKSVVISKLATLFKMSEERATRLLSRPETVIKENIDETTAKKYQLAISKTGAHSKIINTMAEDELDLPEIDPHIKPVHEQNLAREPQPNGLDSALGRASRDVSRDQASNQKLELMDNFTEQHYCPGCGAIKESATAVCLQCGAEPADQKSFSLRGISRVLMKIVAVLVVLGIVAYAAMPLYKDFATQYRIKQGLSLATETRDKVTMFILDTGFWPNQNLDANLPRLISNDVIASILLTENGAFTVTMRADYFETDVVQTLIFKPKLLRGKITWNCMEGTLAKKYRPDECMPRE
ncbi:MAG: pilin [Gammaproteobacteria bacterium]|nr:pilin [Gammaproteobacteria bacterium]